MGDWFNLNSVVGLQKNLINDLKNNTDVASQRAINNVGGNLMALSSSINQSSVLPTLTYQDQVNAILERENSRLAERKQAIDQAEVGQKRLIDLTTNATLRNKAMNKIYVVITVAILCYLGIRLMINSAMVPEKITDILFIILVTGTTIMVINMYYDYDRRNNMDYNMINLGDPNAPPANSTATGSNANGKNLLESRFNGCVKEACCSEGSSFNEKYSICVPNLPPVNSTGIDMNNFTKYKYFIASKQWENAETKCGSVDKYSSTDLSCKEGFTTIGATSDMATPNNPSEMVDYNLYK